eukprot:CAMPEP_0172427214 /NCGR_PEP_ID=MMETSP1064-20121228/41101_1 /TAXON_ID=202472 /ORGANISM="Aulacoseira subarctica , Strain CCAP 1002/5" /LENGTH=230 /DNA_ID=CAMNT_0013171313 /DNA_START=47 /DNA_END=739 /DNA_ORIENTATION=+
MVIGWCSLLLIILVATANSAAAFTFLQVTKSRLALASFNYLQLRSSTGDYDTATNSNRNINIDDVTTTTRRSFFSSSVPFCCAASTLCGIASTVEEDTTTAWAADEDPAVVIEQAFRDIRKELYGEEFTDMGKGGGILFLKKLILNQEWAKIKEFTKFYDAEFRKVKLGKARKLFTDKKIKEEALQLSNAITFDLIGINKSSRVSNTEEALRYWEELTQDIEKFLLLQNK